jgi:hypothetical protein
VTDCSQPTSTNLGIFTPQSPINNQICDKKSVLISVPPNNREITYHYIRNDSQPVFFYYNFTSNYPKNCPIISHALAVSPTNFTAPKEFSILEGKNMF